MNESIIVIFLGIFLSFQPTTLSLYQNENVPFKDNLDFVYNVTTSVMDDVKESIFTIKLKCRGRTSDIVACRLDYPQYQTIYHVSPCNRSIDLCNREHLRADNSYVGRFEIKYRASSVERLTVDTKTTLKQLSFYRIIAGHIFPGVDVSGKNEGTYSLIEESVYGKCEALVKVVRSRIKNVGPENERIGKLVVFPRENNNGNVTAAVKNNTRIVHEMLSVKRTRNLETCYPVPGLLIFDTFFYHPMMTLVHYDVKSSISRIILRDRAFTSYTTEDIAMKNTDKQDGNTTMLHVRTTLTLHSIDPAEKSIDRIADPVSVKLPFVDGFNPVKNINDTDNNNNKINNNTVSNNKTVNNDDNNNNNNNTSDIKI